MAHRTFVNHYDLSALDLLAAGGNFLRQIARGAEREPALHIPFWQRDYDWGEKQIENFLSSVHQAAQSKTDLYLGTLVFGIHSKYPDKILVIDGQQRLRSIQNLLIRSREYFGQGESADVLPLVHGLGDAESPIQTVEAVEASFSSDEQRTAFSLESLKDKGFHEVAPEEWLLRLKFRAVVTSFECDESCSEDPFDVVMSNLFANVNRQAKPLDDIDVAKAKILFGLRRFGCEKEADAFAREWETARMLQLVPTQLADRALLDVDVLDDETEKILTAVPYDPETVRVQFSRYLLLVKAFAEGVDAPVNKEYQEIAYKGAFGDEFEKLCRGDDGDALLAFAGALKTVNDLFLANRDFLLLARRNRVEVKEEGEETEKRPPLTSARNRLLMFQGYVSGGTTRASWFSEKTLMRLLRELSRCQQVDDAALDEILVRLEKELFKDLMSSSGEGPTLTARDWFLWRSLFDVEGNPVYKAAVKGCEKMIETSAASFTVDSGEALLKSLRENAKSYKPDGLPTVTGAAQVEHWAAIERGREKEKEMIDLFESLSNKAHIAEGLNQSMRNDSILKKAGHRDPSWWPTLQFLAAYSACGRGWAVAENSLDQTNLKAFIEPLNEFWKKVAEAYEVKKGDQEEGR